jgi:hypothetical protein
MLRAGMIKRLAGGIYTWMPIGLRVLRKVEKIVREEMDRAGAIELSMPAVQPAELWQESGRWEKYGPELLRCKDRHQRDFVIGPTHEEVITDVVRKEVRSYRQLPVALLPGAGEVPRRNPAAFRGHARPRIPDEGRLLVSQQLRRPAARIPQHVRHLYPHLHPSRARSSVPSLPTRVRSAAPDRTSFTFWQTPARMLWRIVRTPTSPPTSNWPKRWLRAAKRSARLPPPWSKVATPGPNPLRGRRRAALRHPAEQDGQGDCRRV